MIHVTPQAEAKALEFINQREKPVFLKLQVRGKTASEYLVDFLLEEEIAPGDVQIELDQFSVIYSKADQPKLDHATIDWVESLSGSGFRLNNPNVPENQLNSPLGKQIQDILDDEINPSIASHGGHIELVEVQDQKAYVKMSGGCQGCSSANATLKQGIEVRLKEMIPELVSLVDMTDHEQGQTPYFT